MSMTADRKLRGIEARVRGACPRLAEPMETGDGLLARILLPGPVPIDAFTALCAAAGAHGNGLMEITARGSLQVRGLDQASAALFAEAAVALDAGFEDRLPVIATPLPHDPAARFDAQRIAAEIEHGVSARRLALAPKVSVVVDDGRPISLNALVADVRLSAIHDGSARYFVSLAGDAASGTPLGTVTQDDAAPLVTDLLGVLAARGSDTRARDVLRAEHGLAPFLDAAGARLDRIAQPPASRATEPIGLHRLADGACAMGVALPFGQAQALDLIALLRIARANGARWCALAPQRTLLLGPVGEMTAFALGTAADSLGLIVDARDARRRVVACAGAPSCASGLLPARALGAAIAERLSQGRLAVHVSGCAKGCAHPRAAPLTIVGTEKGPRVIAHGTARDMPQHCLRTDANAPDIDALANEIARRVSLETENA